METDDTTTEAPVKPFVVTENDIGRALYILNHVAKSAWADVPEGRPMPASAAVLQPDLVADIVDLMEGVWKASGLPTR